MKYIVLISLLLNFLGYARPISYPDSWTLIQKTNGDESAIFAHYSFSINNSLGVIYKQFNQPDEESIRLQWNHLLNRRNTVKSQWNIYLENSVGVSFYDNNEKDLIGRFGLNTDWETRRYFVSYKSHINYQDNFNDNFFHHSARVGIAPYLGEFGDLHTWLMLEANYRSDKEDRDEKFTLTPVIRFFKSIYLVELGYSSNDEKLFNFIIRF